MATLCCQHARKSTPNRVGGLHLIIRELLLTMEIRSRLSGRYSAWNWPARSSLRVRSIHRTRVHAQDRDTAKEAAAGTITDVDINVRLQQAYERGYAAGKAASGDTAAGQQSSDSLLRSVTKGLVWRLFSTTATVGIALLVLHDVLQVRASFNTHACKLCCCCLCRCAQPHCIALHCTAWDTADSGCTEARRTRILAQAGAVHHT